MTIFWETMLRVTLKKARFSKKQFGHEICEAVWIRFRIWTRNRN
jgi:hypothetical protein